jgi:AraC-like DNA-binding protein
VYYFSRMFKQRAGKTPVKFRRENLAAGGGSSSASGG